MIQVTLINQRFRDIAMTNRDQQEEIAHLNVQLDQLTNIVKVISELVKFLCDH